MRNVKAVKLHAGLFIVGLGDLTDTLPPVNKTFHDMEMTYGKTEEGEGLYIQAKGYNVFVPAANVKSVLFTVDNGSAFKKPE